ncbi:cell wall hydrolase [Pseudomonas sp. P7548]|uniref:cell wall hydrolase n=1 Tax=Pseudomonas sp. P7548 TaxID=2726981 RepID=UPI0015BA4AB9|nr:cell wall hydrolase [Pseudomonas sp. P7548]NWE23141.1 cell wall hydrolase [Pseudomonas sp. P7548]
MNTANTLLCLALNIYHEARGEPEYGQIAVASVTMNRAGWQTENICREVYRERQFSWTHSNAQRQPMEEKAWRKAKTLAAQVLNGEHKDPTDGATHFHASSIKPYWSRSFQKKMRIGRHIFYAEK